MRAADVPTRLAKTQCPEFGDPAWVAPPPRADRSVAIVSTAGLIQRGDRPFGFGSADYRIIDRDDASDLLLTHISTNFDRSGFLEDHEVVFPLQRLREAAAEGEVGTVAQHHFSFMGATNPEHMRPAAGELVRAMSGHGTNIALLVPV